MNISTFKQSMPDAKIVNVGMSIRGEIFKVGEIVEPDGTKYYTLLKLNETVVLSTDRRYIDILFIDMTGMSIE